ncbi:MAG: CHAT domain-containing tetratricopeptide repeat protein [Cyanobacteriota bacterium]|nr:CHAT domain-containing tetratricopeptide repeat protein [Cyanobacteriota bacterium]
MDYKSHADSLVNLASRYSDLKRYADALAALREADLIYEELALINPSFLDGSEAAHRLILMGLAHHELGQSAEALSRTRQAIQLLRKPSERSAMRRADLARALHQFGKFSAAAGPYENAETPAREAVDLWRDLTRQAPGLLDQLSASTTTLATLALRRGRPSEASPLLLEAVSSEVSVLWRQLPLMPEGRRQALVDTLGRRWEIPFSLALQGEGGASLALYSRLNRHGLLHDIERRQAIVSRSTPSSRALVNRLRILNTQLSNPTLAAQVRQNALAESERLQEELHRQLPALQPRLVEIAEVAKHLPADGVLVEFQRFSPYNASKPDKQAWGQPRYLALLLDQRGTPRAVDLGDADALDQAIATALDRTRFQQPDADRAWALVADNVFSPLRGAWHGKRQLLVSPDGQLHRVPFSALALLAGDTSSLPADLTVHTIGSGRDLVSAATAPPPPTTAPLVLANPTTKGWAPLVRAASEGQRVAAAVGTQPLLGSAASVEAVERARGPRVLHIAGHGYFDPRATDDPLLASGLALAGADKTRQPSRPSSPAPASTATSPPLPNPTGSSRPTALETLSTDDGYLTAKEAARLQLDGTQLVVLSACDSGLGGERGGEGLFGLRRALTVAGARGTLLSLWKVPEHATEAFMTRFYALLGQGLPPAEAVRRVQADFRARPPIDGWSDPFYWAGWQYSGLPDPAR